MNHAHALVRKLVNLLAKPCDSSLREARFGVAVRRPSLVGASLTTCVHRARLRPLHSSLTTGRKPIKSSISIDLYSESMGWQLSGS